MPIFKSTRLSHRTPNGSAISLSISFRSKPESASSSETTLPSPTSTFTVSVPSSTMPSTPYPGPRLIKKSTITPQKQKTTLHELVSKTCEVSCTIILRRSLKSEGINLILTDPAAVDFLLLCVGCERDSYSTELKILPGKCPIKEKKLYSAVNDMPALKTVDGNKTNSINEFLRTLTKTHLTLLCYLLQSPFACVSSLSPIYHPTLFRTLNPLSSQSCTPHTFLINKQPEHKEPLFRAHSSRPGYTRVAVFHGTHPCRLPLILSQGLRNMSGTRFQKNGKCLGPGIYLAKEARTALVYANGVEPWQGSRFKMDPTESMGTGRSGVRVLLGCEAVIPVGKMWDGIIVERNEGKVMVRFVWVLPGDMCMTSPGFENEVASAMDVLKGMRGE